MAVAIIVGAIVGVVSFAPLFMGLRLARKATATSNLGPAGALILGVLLSFVVLAVAAVLCIVFVRDMVLPFVLAEVIALIVAAVVFGVVRLVKK